MSLAALIDEILQRHHLRMHRELPVLDLALRERGVPAPLLAAWTELKDLVEAHLAKEEGVLFPAIVALEAEGRLLGCGFEGPLAQMAWEHRRLDHLIAVLRGLALQAGDLAEELLDVLDDLEVHAAREDEELFPAAAELAEVA